MNNQYYIQKQTHTATPNWKCPLLHSCGMRGADVAIGFLALTVLLSVIRLFFTTLLTAPSTQVGAASEGAEVNALLEELRLVRADLAKLESVLRVAEVSRHTGALAQPSAPPKPHAVVPVEPLAPTGPRDGSVLLGIITNPSHIAERAQLRAFYKATFPEEQGKVRPVFVMGNNYYLGNPPKPMSGETKALLKQVMKESDEQGDIIWVDGREGLPHVGKATEKSAAWWQSAPGIGNYGYYCKSDDDSLIHLRSAPRAAAERGRGAGARRSRAGPSAAHARDCACTPQPVASRPRVRG
jgi:hypothetical protein